MSSNNKGKPTAKEGPTEPFKRAVTGCLRALARKPELEVAFAAERPGIAGLALLRHLEQGLEKRLAGDGLVLEDGPTEEEVILGSLHAECPPGAEMGLL